MSSHFNMKVLFSTVHTILQNGREKWEEIQAWKKEKPCEKTGSVSRVEDSFHACKTNMDPKQLENSACLSLRPMPVWTSVFLGVKKKKKPKWKRENPGQLQQRKPGQKTSPLGQRELFNLQAEQDPEFFQKGVQHAGDSSGEPWGISILFWKDSKGSKEFSETMHIPHTKHKLLAANPQLFQVYQKLIRKVVPFLSIGDVLLTWSFWTY